MVITLSWNGLALWRTALAGVLVCFVSAAAMAQTTDEEAPATPAEPELTLPCRIVTLVVPSAVGTATDVLMRVFAEAANASKPKKPIQVVNKERWRAVPQFSRADADGCTLLAVDQSIVANRMFRKSVYAWRRFSPLVKLTETTLAVVVRRGLGDDLASVLEKVREQGGVMAVAEPRTSLDRVLMEILRRGLDVEFEQRPFGSETERYLALLRSEVDIGMLSIEGARRQRETGRIRAVAVTGSERSNRLDDVPTLAEAEIARTITVDHGLFLPDGASDELIAYYVDLFARATDKEMVGEGLARTGTRVALLGGDSYTKYFEDLAAEWRRMFGMLEEEAAPAAPSSSDGGGRLVGNRPKRSGG